MSTELLRCESAAQVAHIAKAYGVRYTYTRYAASVTLDNGVAYYWTAA